jgi:glycosyltransferase involved in cell wall biosynthesis
MSTLSVVIIAKNEAHNIEDCVRSASFADEVIVLDSGSSDETVQLALKAGAKVLKTDWPGFGAQKNRALDAANSDWIFSLDADERITPELATEIRATISGLGSNVHVGFRVPRSSQFCGQFMQHSGWWPDYTTRLVRKGNGRFSDKQVHESLQINGAVGTLKYPMVHYSYRSFDDVLSKLNQYTSAGAADMRLQGKSSGLISAVLHGIAGFFRSYLFRLGFLDGRAGFILAVYCAEASYYKYLKLMGPISLNTHTSAAQPSVK